jgi:dUTP pyrophosphatase
MEKDKVQEYISKLMELNSKIEDVDDESLEDDEMLNDNFIQTLNNVLTSLNKDVEQEMMKGVMETPQQVSPSSIFTVPVKVKKLDPNAVIPTYSKDGDAGMDLTITNIKENTTFSISYGFGIAMEIPKGYVGLVFPRSSVRNQDLILSNCVGVIDSGYRGELQATFKKTQGLDSISYNVGERGAQIVILPYPQIRMVESNELSNTERGEGGFGSTGN